METIPHWIDGRPVSTAGDVIPVADPATGQTVAAVTVVDEDTAKQAVASAAAPLPDWGDWPASRHAQNL